MAWIDKMVHGACSKFRRIRPGDAVDVFTLDGNRITGWLQLVKGRVICVAGPEEDGEPTVIWIPTKTITAIKTVPLKDGDDDDGEGGETPAPSMFEDGGCRHGTK